MGNNCVETNLERRRREMIANMYLEEGYKLQEIVAKTQYPVAIVCEEIQYIKTHMEEFLE